MADITPYNPELVVMKNPVITSKLGFSPLQAQIFLEIVARLHPDDEDFNTIRLNVKEFAQKISMDNAQIYANIRQATRGMQTKIITIDEMDGSDGTDITMFSSAKYWVKKGYVEIEIHKKLKPYFLQIKESHFFSYHIEATRHLKNYAFIRLYWLLVAWKSKKQVIFTLKYVKEALELEGQYSDFYDFKKRVLHPARKEFLKYGEIYFDFEEIKENPNSKRSPIEKLKFLILKNPNWKERKTLDFVDYEIVEPDFEEPKTIDLIKEIKGMSKDIVEEQAKQFIKNHINIKPEDIQSEIINFHELKRNGKEILDPLAWLQTAIEKGFGKGKFEEIQRKKDEKAKQEAEKLQVIEWKKEFEERYAEYREKIISNATNEQIEEAKKLIPNTFRDSLLDRQGNIIPDKDKRFDFYIIKAIAGEQNHDQMFINWTLKHKQTQLEKFGEEYRINPTLF